MFLSKPAPHSEESEIEPDPVDTAPDTQNANPLTEAKTHRLWQD
jgi:hypothetical protein